MKLWVAIFLRLSYQLPHRIDLSVVLVSVSRMCLDLVHDLGQRQQLPLIVIESNLGLGEPISHFLFDFYHFLAEQEP